MGLSDPISQTMLRLLEYKVYPSILLILGYIEIEHALCSEDPDYYH